MFADAKNFSIGNVTNAHFAHKRNLEKKFDFKNI